VAPGSEQGDATSSSSSAPVEKKIEVLDPAYNFTDQADVKLHGKKSIDGARIYDITNFSTAELNGLLLRHKLPKLSFYASFSKHFQFGTDSTTLGFVMHLARSASGEQAGNGGSYVPDGAVWIKGNPVDRKLAHVPAVPAALYHHAALLFAVQTGTIPVHTPTSTTSRDVQPASLQGEALQWPAQYGGLASSSSSLFGPPTRNPYTFTSSAPLYFGGMPSQGSSSSSFGPPTSKPYTFTGGPPGYFGDIESQASSSSPFGAPTFRSHAISNGDTDMEVSQQEPSAMAFLPSATLPASIMPPHGWTQPTAQQDMATTDKDNATGSDKSLKRKDPPASSTQGNGASQERPPKKKK
jgi:hypothetical protein